MPFQTLPDQVTIKYLRNRAVRADHSFVYEGDVVVTYGKTTLTADRLTAYEGTVMRMVNGKPTPTKQVVRGVAEGRVTLIDPAGTVHAERVDLGFDPDHPYQRADNATVRIANGTLRARRAEFGPGDWELYDVEGTTAKGDRPLYLVSSDHVSVSPNKQAIIHQPRVVLFGHTVGKLPTQRASLVQAVQGVHYPTLGYKQDRGFGLTFSGGLATGRREIFSYNSRLNPNRNVNALGQYTRSFLPLDRATEVVAPRTDFSERFDYGFLNTYSNLSPEREQRFLRARRSSLTFGGQLNGGVSDRERGVRYSKVESVYEVGGERGSVGYLGQARLQELWRASEQAAPRLKLVGAAVPRIVPLSPRLQFFNRLNSEAYVGRTAYGWVQGQSGLSYHPFEGLRLSAGGYLSGEVGTPQFRMDELYAKTGLLMRSDVTIGGLSLIYLLKQDAFRGLYDHEFSIRQVVGPVEFFYALRQYPRDRTLGVMLRVEPFVEGLKNRVAELTGKPRSKR